MIEAIKAILPKSSWPWVFAALRQDKIVWNALNDETFVRLVIGRIGRQPSAWSPAALALISLKADVNAEHLAGDVSAYISDDLVQKALDFYQEYRQAPTESPVELPQAGLLALAMRAQYQQLNQWDELVSGLNVGGCYDAGKPAFQTASTCLYNLVPQPLDLLKALLNSLGKSNGNRSSFNPFALVTHVLLSQPLPIQEQVHIFLELLTSLTTTAQLRLLRCIEDQRAQLAEKLATYLLEQNIYPMDMQTIDLASDTLSDQMALLERLNQSIELYQLAKQPESAKRLLSQAENLTKIMQTNFMAKNFWATARGDDPASAIATWKQMKKISPDSVTPIQANLAMHLMDKGDFEAAAQVLDDRLASSHPEAITSPLTTTVKPDYQAGLLLAHARLSLANKNKSEAGDLALQSLEAYTNLLEQKPTEYQGRYGEELQQLAALFLTLGEISEAAKTAELGLASQPDDVEMLFIAAQTQRALGETSKAVQSAQLAVALAPERLDLQHELAISLEATENWVSALEAWTQVVTSFRNEKGEPQAVHEDLRALAACALKARQPKTTIQAMQHILKSKPDDGSAHAMLGQAYTSLGKGEEALKHYRRAIKAAPHEAFPWLALAEQQRSNGQTAEGLDTLRSAAQILPDSPEVLLGLGQACLADNLLVQALPVLRRAAELVQLPQIVENLGQIPDHTALNGKIAYCYGQALYLLGHLPDACKMLAFAHRANPGQVELAQIYAKNLLALGEPHEAISAMTQVIQNEPHEVTPYIIYAHALLAAGERHDLAIQTLRNLLLKESQLTEMNLAEVLALLAEALAANGEGEEALSYYQKVLKSPLADDPVWRVRISLGFGTLALEQDQPKIAITVLQEATQLAPNNPVLYRALSEAYSSAGLTTSALEAARQAMEQAPEDLENLLWFSNQAVKLKVPQEAIASLSYAARIAPKDIDQLLALAEAQLRAQDNQAALTTYKRISLAPEAGLEHLLRNADGLLQLDAASEAIQCLERARSEHPAATDATMVELDASLAEAYLKAGNTEIALETVEKALQSSPQSIRLLRIKAKTYLQLDDPQAALACLEQSLNLYPGDYEMHRQVMEILRVSGNLSHALHHADQMVQNSDQAPSPIQALAMRILAAHFARDMLQPELARTWLETGEADSPTISKKGNLQGTQSSFKKSSRIPKSDEPISTAPIRMTYQCLKAELSLATGEDIAAAEAVNDCLQIFPEHPRVLALQARMMIRRGDAESALHTLELAKQAIESQDSAPAELQAVAEAALELHAWDTTLGLLRRTVQSFPPEPLAYLNLGRALTLQAEYQQLCSALEALRHSPGAKSISIEARQSFEEAIQNAAQRAIVPVDPASLSIQDKGALSPALSASLTTHPSIYRWQVRGRAAFCMAAQQNMKEPSPTLVQPCKSEEVEQVLQSLSKLAVDDSDRGAYLSVLRQLEEISQVEQAATDFPQSHQVQAQLSLAVLREKPDEALTAATTAVNKLPVQSTNNLGPLYNAMLARAAQSTGDYTRAYAAILAALENWPDEPRWNAWAAELALTLKETASAIMHMQKAIEFDPEYTPHYLLYARALVQSGGQRQTAIKILHRILEKKSPETSGLQAEAHALLAEVHLANNESAEALEYYRQAFETPLAKDPEWQLRLSLGLAEAALSQGKTDSALAVLQDAAQALPKEYRVYQKLSETYQAVGLTKDAQDAALQALELAPSDMENILWFANQALELKIPQEASDALTRAAQISPQNVSLLLHLGETQKRAGQVQAAKTSFQKVCVNSHANLDEIIQAAQNMMELDAVAEAITCLERAQTQYLSAPTQKLVRLYVILVDAYLKTGNNKAALETLEKALEHYPADPHLLKTKAGLYQKTNRPQAALACLDQVLNIRPDDLEAHCQVMKILRANGNMQDALFHAEQMVRASSSALEPIQAIASRVQAAEFAQSMLQPKLASLFLNDESLNDTSAYNGKLEWRDFQYLKAELELTLEDGFTSTEENQAILQIAPQHPRSLALQARMMARRGQEEPARQALQAALEALKASKTSQFDQQAVAEAALDLRAWDTSLDLLQHVIQSAPPEPLPYLNLARALVLQAEYHMLCEALNAQCHAPGPKAVSKEARQLFDFSIQNASQRALTLHSDLKNTSQAAFKSLPNSPEIQRWRVRGQAVFQSPTQADDSRTRADSNPVKKASISDQILLEISKLPANPEDSAACIAALRQHGKISQAIQMAKDYPYHPLVQGQLALTLLEQQPDEALYAANAAVENLSVTNTCGIAPLLHALMALCQQSLGELVNAYQSILTALADWDDEPSWHTLAADICLSQDDPTPATRHMEKAVKLEASNPHYQLKLGKVYLRIGATKQAVQALEAASQLTPKQVEPWLALAETHLQLNNLTLAANNADQAIALQPGQIEPQLLRAKIALQAKEPQAAYKHVLSALRIQSDNSQALHLLGKILAALDRVTEAMQALEKAAQTSPDPLPLLLERIRIMRQIQGNEDALNELHKLTSQNPDDVSILKLQAEILAEMGQDEAAIQAAQRALQSANGALENNQRADLHHLAGRLLRRSGHLDQAVHHLSESVLLNPAHLDHYMDLGQTYQERRQYDRALQVYQQAIQIAPKDPRPYHQASLALRETKDYTSAEKMIRQAAILAPEDVRIQRLLSSLVAVNLVSSE